MHCRSLHIHVPSQRRACPDAGGKQVEDFEKGIYPKNKKPNLCPYHSARRFACFVLFCFLIAPLADGQQHTSRQKSSPNRVARLPAAPSRHRQKKHFSDTGPALEAISFDIQIQMVSWSSSSTYRSDGSSCPNTEHILHQ